MTVSERRDERDHELLDDILVAPSLSSVGVTLTLPAAETLVLSITLTYTPLRTIVVSLSWTTGEGGNLLSPAGLATTTSSSQHNAVLVGGKRGLGCETPRTSRD